MNTYTLGLIIVNSVIAGYLVYVWQKVKALSKDLKKQQLNRPRRKKVFLTKEEAGIIKKRLDNGASYKAIAKEIGCGPTLIWRIKNDKWSPKRVK